MSTSNKEYLKRPSEEDVILQKQFVQKAEKIFVTFREYKPDLDLLKEILDFPGNFTIFEVYGSNILQDMSDYFQAGVTQAFEKNCKDFMSLIKKLFFMLTERQQAKFAARFLNVWQGLQMDHTPYFAIISENREQIITNSLEKLALNPESVDETTFLELFWYMIITPAATLQQLFKASTQHPQILQFFTSLCQRVPSMFYNKKLKIWHSEYELKKDEPMLDLVFKRIFYEAKFTVTEVEQWENIDRLSIKLIEPLSDGTPLMDSVNMLDIVFTELNRPCRFPMKSVEILTRIAARILDFEYLEPLNFKIATSLREQAAEKVFLTPTIIYMMLKLVDEFHGKSRNIIENVYFILKSIGIRMTKDQLQFDDETRDKMLEDFKKEPWWMEHAMCTWYKYPLGCDKMRVSSNVFEALPLFARDELYVKIPLENREMISPEGYLKDLLNMALVDSEIAKELFLSGCSHIFEDGVLEKMLDQLLSKEKVRNVPICESERIKFGEWLYTMITTIEKEEHVPYSLIDALMEGDVAMEEKAVVLCTQFVPTTPLVALLPILQPVWPSRPVTMPSMSSKEVKRLARERAERAKRHLAELHAEHQDILRQQWLAAGVIYENNDWNEATPHRESNYSPEPKAEKHGSGGQPVISVADKEAIEAHGRELGFL